MGKYRTYDAELKARVVLEVFRARKLRRRSAARTASPTICWRTGSVSLSSVRRNCSARARSARPTRRASRNWSAWSAS